MKKWPKFDENYVALGKNTCIQCKNSQKSKKIMDKWPKNHIYYVKIANNS
jgi:hypothetical protein